MGLLRRLTHIWPFWDIEHLGGGSIVLVIVPARQEGPLLDGHAFVGLPWFCHRQPQVLGHTGQEAGPD